MALIYSLTAEFLFFKMEQAITFRLVPHILPKSLFDET